MKAQSNEKKLPNTTLVPKTNASDERERERERVSEREEANYFRISFVITFYKYKR